MDAARIKFWLERRQLVVGVLCFLAMAFAAAIPQLEVRFAPEELVAPDDDASRARDDLDAAFGADENAIVVLIETDEVLDLETLRWSLAVARRLERAPGVERVESLVTTPLPFARQQDDGETLDDLAAETAEESAARERLENAVLTLVGSDPERFPGGPASLRSRPRQPLVAPGEPLGPDHVALLEELLSETDLIEGRLLSEDRDVAVIVAQLPARSSTERDDAVVAAADELLSEHPPPSGVRASLAGLPVMRRAMIDALRQDQLLLVTLAFAGSLLVLVLGMRSFGGVVLPLATVGITLAITLGGMALAGEPINLLTNIIPPLLVTIGLAEAVHMVLRYREALRSLGDRVEAAARTLQTMWLPCFVTTFTTAIGFGALALQETEVLRRFGVIAAIASMLAYVVTVLFVPASLPSVEAPPARAALPGVQRLDRAIVLLASASAARPWQTIAAAAAILLMALMTSRGLVIDSTLLDQFARDSEIARTTRVLERELDGVRRLSIGIQAEDARFWSPQGLRELDALTSWLRAQPGVLRATSHADLLHETWAVFISDPAARSEPLRSTEQARALAEITRTGGRDPTARFVTESGAWARIEVRLADRGASRILEMLERFETQASETVPGARLQFAGEAWDASRGLDRIVSSLGSLTAAVVLIFMVMTLLFRSIRLGLLSVPPNALPLALTLAYMVARGIALNAATVIVFTVSLGLAVDGATHVIARFREELEHGGDRAEVLARTMEGSGRGVVLSSVTLLLGYAALLFSAFEPVRLFGELSAVAIAGSLIAQIVLLPALLAAGVPRVVPGRAAAPVASTSEPAG